MKSGFRLKLFLIMIVFATTIAFAIAIFDQYRLTTQLEESNLLQIQQIEDVLAHSLQTIDKVYYFFDADTAGRMESHTDYLLNLYETNSNFNEWDFEDLKERIGMDIYIINQDNVITHSSLKRDIGIDFEECCGTLAKILDERRLSGRFYHDGMDIDQGSGDVTKYSYMATKDKKFIIELGINLQDEHIFNEFNFLRTSKELVDRYSLVHDITIFNIGGVPFGDSSDSKSLTSSRRKAFEQTLASGEIVEIQENWNGEVSVFRYVPITSAYDHGQTKNKVIEIVYSDKELQAVIKESRKSLLVVLAVVLIVTFILSLIISKIVSKPIYMAFHDSLTGLKNRGAFEEMLSKYLRRQNSSIALLMFDLDNFKLVNDYFGHDYGDDLLKLIGYKLRTSTSISKKIDVFRLGGDEFAMVLQDASSTEAEKLAEEILNELELLFKENDKYKNINITASLGIAIAQGGDEDLDALYKKADIAMYKSKEKGKNQYYLYSG